MSRVVVSWSGGKESCFACYKAISEGYEVSCLMNFISKDGRCMSHGLDSKLILAQSEAIGIPLVQREVAWGTYEQRFKSVIRELKRSGVEGVVFGDISNIAGHEGWIDRVCSELGIKPIKPLWGSDPKQLLSDFVEEGFESLVVTIKAELFGEEWLGREVDEVFIKDLSKFREKADIDFCGELGEYHTFVYDGPIFKKRLAILDFRKNLMEGYWFLDIKDFRIVGKREGARYNFGLQRE
jgi:uncharacterized protein (TIGR00290 family)